jgi:DNA adenine methylase
MQTTTIKPILKYPGAKWNLAAWIISHFPAHAHYVEPYFGSGAVFFNKTPAKHEVINDLSGDVVNLFRVMREQGAELAGLIEMTPWAREEYDLSFTIVESPLERARRFVVRACQANNSGIASRSGWRNAITPDQPLADNWRLFGPRIRLAVDRLRDVMIDNRPALEIVTRYSAPNVLIYADPPYVLSTRNGKMYPHEMTDNDHALLMDALDAHPGPVVLSGYRSALYDERLKHWRTRAAQTQTENGNTRTEVLWLNQICIDRLGFGPMFDGA